MAKITRATQKVFGESGAVSYFGQPGSLPLGTKLNTKDPATIQALAAYLDGLQSVVASGTYKPALEDLNSLLFLITRQLAYIMQDGIPEWDSGTTYYTGSIVKYGSSPYVSLQDTNLNKSPLTETAYWKAGLGTSTIAGDYKVCAQAVDHDRWLLCTAGGRTVSRSTYSGLYAVVGTSFGTGDGVSTFGLPDPAGGRRLAILDASDADFNALGKTGGEKTHILTAAELPTGQYGVVFGRDASAGVNKNTPETFAYGASSPHNVLDPYIVGGNLFISYQ